MSVSRSTYRHRLSGEDVRKTRILITKDAWKLFPGPGERVEAYFHPRTLSPVPTGAKNHKG